MVGEIVDQIPYLSLDIEKKHHSFKMFITVFHKYIRFGHWEKINMISNKI